MNLHDICLAVVDVMLEREVPTRDWAATEQHTQDVGHRLCSRPRAMQEDFVLTIAATCNQQHVTGLRYSVGRIAIDAILHVALCSTIA